MQDDTILTRTWCSTFTDGVKYVVHYPVMLSCRLYSCNPLSGRQPMGTYLGPGDLTDSNDVETVLVQTVLFERDGWFEFSYTFDDADGAKFTV